MKKLKEKIDSTYGKNGISKGDVVKSVLFLSTIDIFLIVKMCCAKESIETIIYGYIACLILVEILMFIAGYFHGKKENMENCKDFKQWSMYITLGLFLILLFPVICIYLILHLLGIHLNVEAMLNQVIMLMIEISFYLIGIWICILDISVIEFEFHKYIIWIACLYFGFSIIRGFVNKIIFLGNFRNQYSYRYQIMSVRRYFLIIISVLSGVAGVFIARYGNEGVYYIYAIMPVIIFSGGEQIRMTHISVIEEKNVYLKNMYEELNVLNNVAFLQIKDISKADIVIRIKLSSDYHTIECYKEYLLKQYMGFIPCFGIRKRRLIKEALNGVEELLRKEYKFYQEDGKENLMSDVESVIEKLAECILELYKSDIVSFVKGIREKSQVQEVRGKK